MTPASPAETGGRPRADPDKPLPWLGRAGLLLVTLTLAGAGWAAVYALGALDLFLAVRRYTDVRYADLAAEFVPSAIAWTLLTPAVLWMLRQSPFSEGRRSRALAEHLGVSGVLTISLGALEVLRVLWRLGLPLSFFGEIAANHTNLRVLQHAANYWIVIAVAQFTAFYRSVRSGERQARVLRSQLAGAQLSALKAKLHPHFLFNTFNAIASLVRTGQNDRAVTMISDISGLLRHTLENDHLAEVTLRTELGFIRTYLGIERERFGERLQYRESIDPAALDALVPNLVLQPLAENAVKHGISRMTTPGFVELKAFRLDDELRVEIRNSRPEGGGAGAVAPSLGIGLSTTRDRLAHAYGGRAGLRVELDRDGVFKASIRLPFRTEALRQP